MSLHDWPLRRKLTALLLLISALVLVVTTGAFVTYQVMTYRQRASKDLSTVARIMAANATAALAFVDEADAAELLSTLRADEHIVAAVLYGGDGGVFARFVTPGAAVPSRPGPDGYRFAPGQLIAVEPVARPGGTRLGTLYVASDTQAMTDALRLSAVIALTVAAVAMLAAYGLARLLQRRISEPILALAETARAVSERGDYAVRAPAGSRDEIGTLTHAFNHMLGRIEEQERALREGKQRLDFALRAGGIGTWHWDLKSDEIIWDDQMHWLFGLEPGTFSGRPDAGFAAVHPDDRQAVEAKVAAAIERGTAYEAEFRVVHPDGSLRVMAARGTVYRDAGGEMQRLIGLTWDVSDQKRMREELQAYATELERRVAERTAELEERNEALRRNAAELLASNAELDAFAYSVSHDLRAPLRSIDGFSQVVLEDYAARLDDAGRDALRRVRAATQRMGTLIDDLLKLARVARADFRVEPVNLSQLARDVAGELAPPNVEVVVAPDIEALGDPRLMTVVLQNLIGNGIKYSAKRPKPRVEFGATGLNGERVYYVRDNGAGFDMRYADKLFGVFQRLHSADEFEGSGVGLATVRRIVNRHGGRIWAESAVDQGATFYFTL